jgi:TctA family transporter
MPSIESKNWITALVVSILGLALATIGIVLAYKQLRRTKHPDDVEAAGADTVEMAVVAFEGTENPR